MSRKRARRLTNAPGNNKQKILTGISHWRRRPCIGEKILARFSRHLGVKSRRSRSASELSQESRRRDDESVRRTADHSASTDLKFVLFERFERRWASAQGVILGHSVEDVNAPIVEQGRLGNRALGYGRTDLAALDRLSGDFLNRFEVVAFSAPVFIERHDRYPLLS
jgi:hypothetical protein